MERYVVRDIKRTDKVTTDELARLGVATVYEAQGQIGLMDDGIKPIQKGISICGSAVTVTCYAGDNLMVHAAVEVCHPGDVLVVTTIGEEKAGMVGELLVQSLMQRGVKGLIMDSGIRDVARIREKGFPVWTRSIICKGTTKIKGGWINSKTVCGGVMVSPGDLIVADDDGVVIVRQAEIESSLNAAKAREKNEQRTMERINRGELGVDFYGYREVLEKQGVVYYDNPDQRVNNDR